jgi:hypothetical protein
MVTPMSVVNGVDETTTPEFIDWYVDKRKIPLARSGMPEDVSGTVVFPRLRLLPLHDGPAAGRRWRIDEHVLTTRNHDRKADDMSNPKDRD